MCPSQITQIIWDTEQFIGAGETGKEEEKWKNIEMKWNKMKKEENEMKKKKEGEWKEGGNIETWKQEYRWVNL